MKKRILSLVLSVVLLMTLIPLSVFAKDVTRKITNIDGSKENFTFDNAKFKTGTDSKGATILISLENERYVYYPNTDVNIGLADTLDDVTVPETSDGLELNKSVTQYPIYPNGEYRITLEAFTTGEVTVEKVVMPTDIVLVIDQSDSMFRTDMTGGKTRQQVMKDAVDSFIASVQDSATQDLDGNELSPDEYIDHRIAMVVYGTDVDGNDKTKLLTTDFVEVSANQAYNDVKHTNMVGDQLKVKSYEDAEAYLKGLINELPKNDANQYVNGTNLTENSRTPIHRGMEEANTLLATAQGDAEHLYDERNHVVVMLTDGVPAYGNTKDGIHGDVQWFAFDEDCANASIDAAYDTKNKYDATVFSIGFTKTADASVITGANNAEVGARWNANYSQDASATNDKFHTKIANRFLNFLSSNSKVADDLGVDSIRQDNDLKKGIQKWEITKTYDWKNDGKYLAATDAEKLNQAFEEVLDSVSADTMDLPGTTQVHDYVSDYFKIPDSVTEANIADNVKVYKVDATGGETNEDGTTTYSWDNRTEITDKVTIKYLKEKKGIQVEGFNYTDNFVSTVGRDDPSTAEKETDFYGSKLVIQFNVEATDGFIGGNDVITNTEDSGVYVPDKDGNINDPFQGNTFVPPNTNVIVDYDIGTDDKIIYLGNQIGIDEILRINNQEISGILNEFVNIQFSIYSQGALDEDGNFAKKITVEGEEYTVYKRPDRYYYFDSKGGRTYVETGGNYEIVGDTLYYQKVDENGNKLDKNEIRLDPTQFYYVKDGVETTLEADDAAYYEDLVLATFHIPASQSAKDAMNLKINEGSTSIQPGECKQYDLRCFANPNHDDKDSRYLAETLNQAHADIWVHVIQPQVHGDDIWVDYDATINVEEDGTSPTEWGDVNDGNINPEGAHNEVVTKAPTVYYIYKDKHTGEYYKLPYQIDWNGDGKFTGSDETDKEEIGQQYTHTTLEGDIVTYTLSELDFNIKSEKQYEIVGVQTLSSDGEEDVEYWSFENEKHDKDITDNDINVYLNKYDIDIEKKVSVTESDWEFYKQSFIFEVSQVVDNEEYTTEVVMDPDSFERAKTPNADGTYDYTCTKTVKDLFAGQLDATVTEDTSWSWRYTFKDATSVNSNKGDTIQTTVADNVVTVRYSHELYEDGNDTKVDTTGDGEPDAIVLDGTGRYVNSNDSLVFINEENKPASGNVDTFYVNELTSNTWLSHDDVAVNEFSGLTAIDKTGGTDNE